MRPSVAWRHRSTVRENGALVGAVLIVAVCAAFTVASLWLVAADRGDRRTAIGAVAFFGLCLGLAIWLLRVRGAKWRNLDAHGVEIVGGVPIRARPRRPAAALAVASAALSIVSWAMDGPLALLAFAVALLCAALVPVLLFGPPSRRALVFEPEGLQLVEPSWQVRVPWDEIVEARLVDVQDTLLVALTLRDTSGLVPTGRGGDLVARRRLARAVSLNRAFYGCDVTIGPGVHGLDAVLFLRAIETYVSDAGARARLAPRTALQVGS